MIDWNDLRHFLAVAKAGTTLAAARELGVSQSTAARRIDALETALGVKLFDRRQSGYALTDIGKELAETATGVEVAAAAFASKAAALRRGLTGTVRITTNDLFAGEVLMPSLNAFRQAHPRILLEPPPYSILRTCWVHNFERYRVRSDERRQQGSPHHHHAAAGQRA